MKAIFILLAACTIIGCSTRGIDRKYPDTWDSRSIGFPK